MKGHVDQGTNGALSHNSTREQLGDVGLLVVLENMMCMWYRTWSRALSLQEVDWRGYDNLHGILEKTTTLNSFNV